MRAKTSVALLVVVALGVVFGLHEIVDPDLFQHVAVGRAIVAHPDSVGVSYFTDAFPEYRYIEDKWLESVVVASVDRVAGPDGLMLYQILLPAIVAAVWFLMLRAWRVDAPVAVAGVAAALVACAFRLEPRPDTWTHAWFAGALGFAGTRLSTRTAAVVAFVGSAIWTNVHGYFVMGWFVLAAGIVATILGEEIPLLRGPEGRAHRGMRGLLLLAAAMVGSCVHPQGWNAALWPFRQVVILRDAPVIREAIVEFVPSSELFRGAPIGYAWWAGLTALAAALSGIGFRRAGPRTVLAAAFAMPWLVFPPAGLSEWPYRATVALVAMAAFEIVPALRAGRFFAVIVLTGCGVLAVPLLRNLSLLPPAALLLCGPVWSEAAGSARGVRSAKAVAAGFAVLATLARLDGALAPGTHRFPARTGWGLAPGRFAPEAVSFLDRENIPGPVLNNFDIAGYLQYRTHPGRRVFITGNTSMYPPSWLEFYRRDLMSGRVDPEDLHRRFGIRSAIFDHAAMETPALIARLAANEHWMLAFADRAGCVFVRRDDAPPTVRARGPVVLDRLVGGPPVAARRSVFPGLNFPIFLRACGRGDLAIVEADRLSPDAGGIEAVAFAAATAESMNLLSRRVPALEAAMAAHPASTLVRTWLARATFVRGVERVGEGRRSEGRADFERSRSLAPKEPGPWIALAHLAVEDGDREAAQETLAAAARAIGRQAFRAAVREDPVLDALERRD